MKKLRDNPIAMRSLYTSVFMAAARDVIDTTEAAPNTMPDSVRSDRNLCPRISRHASPISSSQSRIAQRLDGREPRRAHRREHVGEDATRGRAEGHAGAEFAHALDDRGEQDVRDHDAAGHQRHYADDEKDEVEQQQELAGLLPRPLARRADVEVLDSVPRKQQAAHLRLRAHAAYRRTGLEGEEVEMVISAILRNRRGDGDVGALVPILERVVLPRREVELLALQHADHAIALLADADDLTERGAGAAEQRIGVL